MTTKGKEINTDTKQDIDQLITEFKRNGKGKNVVIFLAFSKAGWFGVKLSGTNSASIFFEIQFATLCATF